MPDILLTLLLLGVPLIAGLAGSALVVSAYSDLRSRSLESDVVPLARPRLPVFYALSVLPFVFGLVLWFLLAGVEESHGPLQGPAGTVAFWMAGGFAVVAISVHASQALIARVRLRELISIHFGRVLPLLVVPNNSVIFAMVLSILVLGRLDQFLGPVPLLSEAAASTIALVFQVYALASLANPVGAALSQRVRDITTIRGFTRAVTYVEIPALISIGVLAWGFLQIGSL